MSPVAGPISPWVQMENFKPGFQNPGWKKHVRDLGNRASPPSHMNTMKLEVNKRDLGKPGLCEEALCTALERIFFYLDPIFEKPLQKCFVM